MQRRTNRAIVKSTSTDGRCTVNGTTFKFNAPAVRTRALPARPLDHSSGMTGFKRHY